MSNDIDVEIICKSCKTPLERLYKISKGYTETSHQKIYAETNFMFCQKCNKAGVVNILEAKIENP